MIIVGCDYHPRVQQIAFVDTETGELNEQRLEHREPAEAFYRELASRGKKVYSSSRWVTLSFLLLR
jgi:transposase